MNTEKTALQVLEEQCKKILHLARVSGNADLIAAAEEMEATFKILSGGGVPPPVRP